MEPLQPRPALRAVALRSALWLALGVWIGAWTLFGAVVAPTAFRVLPTTEMAGALVGPMLRALHLYGACAGVALALLARALGRGPLCVGLPFLLAALCLYSEFGITAEISEIRDLAFGPEGSAKASARFQSLHRRSVAVFASVGVGALVLLGLHARAESPPRGERGERRK